MDCPGAGWELDAGSDELWYAMQRAKEDNRSVTLTLRYLGPGADDPTVSLEVLGLEVRGIDDLASVFSALRRAR